MRISGFLLVIALIGCTVGCVARQRCCAPREITRASGLVPADASPDEPNAIDTELIRSLADRTRAGYAPPAAGAKPMKVLALSGGGMYGAYTVGVLSGWTATGTRPCFDVVTGVSTGALIATFAFLGPEYDRQLVERFTTVSDRDIYRRRPVPAVVWSDSAADSAPLKRLIDAEVTDDVLRAVAQAHAAGRRLYVGTTNIDTRRLVIWDMGAIASSGRPDAKDLYRKVLLASASPPGFLPPVEIDVQINGRRYTELHVDGGATTGVFLRASALNVDREALKAGQQPLAGSDAYVIVAGKLYVDPACTDRRAVRIGTSSLRSLLYEQTRGELFRIYTLCTLAGMKFHLAAIPEDFRTGTEAMSFDPVEMRKLYEAGYAAATGGRAWRDTPPGAEPYEQTRPRTGTQFYAPGAAAPGP
ncbi:MAG TPA: patatin-like phospholipase family protein [Gemmataceae bacterium]|nr:patatin-like phospholipase family protein [Gemmataceae bacterium]